MSGGSSDGWLARLGEHPLLRRRPIAAHAVTIVLVAIALGLRFALGDKLVGVPYITFYSIVAISAFVGGWMAGVSATVLSVLGSLFFFAPPIYSFKLMTPADLVGLTVFAITCGLMVMLTHIAVRAAEVSAGLA